ncbi:hypothetical protein ACFYRJ_36655 [Streptomyces sp. NPDC005531]|uniref:hypothetical protein n=1 Tax=Streptomyces sp. NPDC005531 TaxID=3364722 RepID=UPI0036B52EB6
MPTPNRAHASAPRPAIVCRWDRAMPASVSWPSLVSTGLLAGAARHVGFLLVGLAVAW